MPDALVHARLAGAVMTSLFCLHHKQPADENGICPTYTGAPDGKGCDCCCPACTGPMVVLPESWPYCRECGWAPDAEAVAS